MHAGVHDIVHTLFKKLAIYAETMRRTGDVEAVHQFRTGIKELNAVFQLFSFQELPQPLALPDGLEKMYKSAGRLRNIQLLSQKITAAGMTMPLDTNLPLAVQQQFALSKRYFLTGRQLQKCGNAIIHLLPQQPDSTTIQAFFLAKSGNIEAILHRPDYTDEQLHELRKQIKSVLGVFAVLQKLQLAYFYTFRNRDFLIKTEKLALLLGHFQDACMMMRFLENENTQQLLLPGQITFLHMQFLKEKKVLKQQILLFMKNQQAATWLPFQFEKMASNHFSAL